MSYVSTTMKKDISISSIVTIHYFEYSRDFVFHGEAHDFWEILYVDKGSVKVQTDDFSRILSMGDIIFHKPNEFHAMRALDQKALNLVAISFLCYSPTIDFFKEKMFTLTVEERKIISYILAEAQNAFSNPLHIPTVEWVELAKNPPFGSQQLVISNLELLLITLRRRQEAQQEDETNSLGLECMSMNLPVQSERLKQIIEFMEEHICEQLSVEQICLEFSVSRSMLQSLFRKERNCGTMEYFNLMKIRHAKELMRDSKMNLTEIAHFLSYSSLQYFSKQFKNLTGMSPLEYISSVKGISQAVEKATPQKK